MKVDELMVGNWVLFCGDKYQIHKEDFSANYDFEPIPLTVEILEKNEFKKWTWWKYHKDDTITYAVGGGCHVEIEERMINGKNEKEFNLVQSCNDSGDYGYESDYICDVQYVHKLQNALKVLEIEKEIIL